MIPGMAAAEAFFRFAEQALRVYDYHQKTKHQREFLDLRRKIKDEESKPVYGEGVQLRDQNKLDHLYYELYLFIERWGKEADKVAR